MRNFCSKSSKIHRYDSRTAFKNVRLSFWNFHWKYLYHKNRLRLSILGATIPIYFDPNLPIEIRVRNHEKYFIVRSCTISCMAKIFFDSCTKKFYRVRIVKSCTIFCDFKIPLNVQDVSLVQIANCIIQINLNHQVTTSLS